MPICILSGILYFLILRKYRSKFFLFTYSLVVQPRSSKGNSIRHLRKMELPYLHSCSSTIILPLHRSVCTVILCEHHLWFLHYQAWNDNEYIGHAYTHAHTQQNQYLYFLGGRSIWWRRAWPYSQYFQRKDKQISCGSDDLEQRKPASPFCWQRHNWQTCVWKIESFTSE